MAEDKSKKIVVTGGTGFLGAHLIRGLFEKGFTNIHGLKREHSKTDLLGDLSEKVSWIEGDILEVESVTTLMHGAETVIHCAAKVSYHPGDKQEVMKVNVAGTANIVNICLDQKVEKLIFISSVAALGRPSNHKIIDEETEWEESKYNTQYGFSKYLAELEVWRGMAEGLKVMIFNPSMILGPSFWGDSSTKLFMHVLNKKGFYPSGSNGFIDVRDAVSIVLKMMQTSLINERFIGVGGHLTYFSLFKMIAEKAGLKAPGIAISKPIARIVAFFNLISSKLSGSDPTVTEDTVKISYGKFEYSNEKSVNLLHHKYVPLEKTVSDTVEIYMESKLKGRSFGYFKPIFS